MIEQARITPWKDTKDWPTLYKCFLNQVEGGWASDWQATGLPSKDRSVLTLASYSGLLLTGYAVFSCAVFSGRGRPGEDAGVEVEPGTAKSSAG